MGPDGSCDETATVSFVMKVGFLLGCRLDFATPCHARMQRDVADPGDAIFILGHDADGIVLILIGDEACIHGHMQKPEHVATGDGRNEGFFRIDTGGIRPRFGHDAGGR